MRIQKKYRPELIASKDGLRPAIQEPWISNHKGKDVLVATNGRGLVVVPVELEEGEEGQVPQKALKFARANVLDRKSTSVSFALNGSVQFENGWSMPRGPKQTDFPNWTTAIPEEAPISVSINVKQLFELAQAMGCEIVSLHIKSPSDAVIVKPTDRNGAFGVLMPYRT